MTNDSEKVRALAVPNGDPIATNDADWMADFNDLYSVAWGDGAIPAKFKELAGVSLAVALRCEACLRHHVGLALQNGASREQVVEAMRLGLIAGGSAGIPTMRAAYEILDAA